MMQCQAITFTTTELFDRVAHIIYHKMSFDLAAHFDNISRSEYNRLSKRQKQLVFKAFQESEYRILGTYLSIKYLSKRLHCDLELDTTTPEI